MAPRYVKVARCAIIIATPMIAGGISSYLTSEYLSTWYIDMRRPWLTPPHRLFGPIWTTVYGCMGISCYLVWRKGTEEAILPLTLLGSHLVFNWIWAPVFCSREELEQSTGLVTIMDLAVIACMYMLRGVNRTASNLLWPYAGWLSLVSPLSSPLSVFHTWWDGKQAEAKGNRPLPRNPLSLVSVTSGKKSRRSPKTLPPAPQSSAAIAIDERAAPAPSRATRVLDKLAGMARAVDRKARAVIQR